MTPTDYNPYIHGKAPTKRVELLAWKHRQSADYSTARAASAILVASGCLCTSSLIPFPPQYAFRRTFIASNFWLLRRALRPATQGFGRPAHYKPEPTFQSPVDVRSEARINKPSRVNFHDA